MEIAAHELLRWVVFDLGLQEVAAHQALQQPRPTFLQGIARNILAHEQPFADERRGLETTIQMLGSEMRDLSFTEDLLDDADERALAASGRPPNQQDAVTGVRPE